MTHDIYRTLIYAGIPSGGFAIRWVLVRRSPSPQPSLVSRAGTWFARVITANVRLVYTEQNLKDAKMALAVKTQEYAEEREASAQLRTDIRQLREDVRLLREEISRGVIK